MHIRKVEQLELPFGTAEGIGVLPHALQLRLHIDEMSHMGAVIKLARDLHGEANEPDAFDESHAYRLATWFYTQAMNHTLTITDEDGSVVAFMPIMISEQFHTAKPMCTILTAYVARRARRTRAFDILMKAAEVIANTRYHCSCVVTGTSLQQYTKLIGRKLHSMNYRQHATTYIKELHNGA